MKSWSFSGFKACKFFEGPLMKRWILCPVPWKQGRNLWLPCLAESAAKVKPWDFWGKVRKGKKASTCSLPLRMSDLGTQLHGVKKPKPIREVTSRCSGQWPPRRLLPQPLPIKWDKLWDAYTTVIIGKASDTTLPKNSNPEWTFLTKSQEPEILKIWKILTISSHASLRGHQVMRTGKTGWWRSLLFQGAPWF